MKKYLFLIFLFIIYLILNFSNKTKKVISYDSNDKSSVSNITINFKNGINSNTLEKLFKKYNNEYYIKEIKGEKNMFDVSCNNIKICIKEIASENLDYNINYFISGFKVKSIKLLSYKDDFISFADINNLDYSIN